MKTIKLGPRGVDLVLQIRNLRDETLEKCTRLLREAQEQVAAIQTEANLKGRALWSDLLVSEAINPADVNQYYLDMNYLDEHRLCFLRHEAPEAPPAEPFQFVPFNNDSTPTRH